MFTFWGGGAKGRQGEGSIAAASPDSPPCPFNAPWGPQGACRRPPGGPQRSPEKAHIKQMCFLLIFLLLSPFFYFFVLHVVHLFLHVCYVFPYPSSRFGREAPRGGPREAPEEAHGRPPEAAPRGGPWPPHPGAPHIMPHI